MGCDIHAYAASRSGYGDSDIYFVEAELSLDRNYDLFAHMAGVRNYNGVEPIAEPRGIMRNLSYMPSWILDTDDGHSHSWLTVDEFEQALNRCERKNTSAQAALAFMKVYQDAGRDTRIVFCFDN